MNCRRRRRTGSTSIIDRSWLVDAGEVWAALRAVWELVPVVDHQHRGCASAERRRSRPHLTGRGISARRLRCRVAGASLFLRSTATSSTAARSSTRPTSTSHSLGSINYSRPARRLENAASRVAARFMVHFASCDWDAMARLQTDNVSFDDRRRVVNAGIRLGREAAIQDARANAEVGAQEVTSTVIATRGERLVLLPCPLLG